MIYCPASPPSFSNSIVSYNKTSYSSEATYMCEDGYRMEPETDHSRETDTVKSTIYSRCLATGEWQELMFTCISKYLFACLDVIKCLDYVVK